MTNPKFTNAEIEELIAEARTYGFLSDRKSHLICRLADALEAAYAPGEGCGCTGGCMACAGSGKIAEGRYAFKVCSVCSGTGRILDRPSACRYPAAPARIKELEGNWQETRQEGSDD